MGKRKIIDCPKCGEGDERALGSNVCGLCECKFYVRPRGEITVLDKRIGAAATVPTPEQTK